MVVPGWGLWKAAHGCAAAASQPWMADRAEKQPPRWDDPPAAGVIQSLATGPLRRMGEEQEEANPSLRSGYQEPGIATRDATCPVPLQSTRVPKMRSPASP